jgi:hypothetical protein
MTVPQQIRCYKEVKNITEDNIIDLCSSIQTETWMEVSRENDTEKNGTPSTAFLTIILT